LKRSGAEPRAMPSLLFRADPSEPRDLCPPPGVRALETAALAGLRRDPMLRIHPADVRNRIRAVTERRTMTSLLFRADPSDPRDLCRRGGAGARGGGPGGAAATDAAHPPGRRAYGIRAVTERGTIMSPLFRADPSNPANSCHRRRAGSAPDAAHRNRSGDWAV
jgi:hypothetical protein